MSLAQLISETIDLRSFPSVWYWIVVIVVWSRAAYVVLGVPMDMIERARRAGYEGQAAEELTDLARVGVLRRLRLQAVGVWLTFAVAFGLTALLVLGFGYGVEMAQAVFLIAVPMTGVLMLSLATARRIRAEDPDTKRLCDILLKHRLWVIVISALALFFTAVWGMIVNLTLPTWY